MQNGFRAQLDRIYHGIVTRLIIDRAGRVVLPKPVRNTLKLEPGEALEMENSGDQITLRPVRGNGLRAKEHGIWVFQGGETLLAAATDEVLDRVRKERDLINFGGLE